MLPKGLVDVASAGGKLVPAYLTTADEVWLADLLAVYEAHVGKPRAALERSLCEPLPHRSPPRASCMARHVLDRVYESRVRAPVAPSVARLATARAMACLGSREAALAAAASELQHSVAEVEASLLADIPSARLVQRPKASRTPAELRLDVNLSLAAGLLRHARSVSIRVQGGGGELARHAQRLGLIAEVVVGDLGAAVPSDGLAEGSRAELELQLTGPLSLFRHTLVYGRAMASLLPLLGRHPSFSLVARCELGMHVPVIATRSAGSAAGVPSATLRDLLIGPQDPLPWTSTAARRRDCRERRLIGALERAASQWLLRRDPPPLRVLGQWVFPCAELLQDSGASRRFLIEISGYYTPESLSRRIELLGCSEARSLILCVDGSRACGQGEVTLEHPRVLVFDRVLEPGALLKRLDRLTELEDVTPR